MFRYFEMNLEWLAQFKLVLIDFVILPTQSFLLRLAILHASPGEALIDIKKILKNK